MKLSANIIFSELKKRYPQAEFLHTRSGDNEMVFSCPRYVDGKAAAQVNQIFVTLPERLDTRELRGGPCLLITPDSKKPCAGASGLSVIAAPGVSVVELYNQVLSIFERYTQWDDMLQDLVFSNAPLEEYLKCCFPLIGNSMTVHDNDFAYIARVKQYAPEGDFIDPEFLFRAEAQSEQSVFSTREVVHFRDGESQMEYLFLNLFNGNTAAGRLVVINDHHAFEPQDRALIRHMGRYLEATLTYAAFSGASKDVRRDSLLELLSGKRHSEDKAMHLQAVSPWAKLKEDQKLYCLTGTCRDSEVSERYIAYRLERALPEAISMLYDSKIVVLCMNQPHQSQEDFFRQLESVLEQLSVVAGCSEPFTDVMDLIYYYRQADFALSRLKQRPEQKTLSLFREHTVEYFLHYGCSELPVRLICAPCIMKLAEHDKTASVSYCDSLREYLNSGMNSAEAARRLNIRRNTFLARLERILRWVDVDLEQEDERLYILFSLRLLQGQGERRNEREKETAD